MSRPLSSCNWDRVLGLYLKSNRAKQFTAYLMLSSGTQMSLYLGIGLTSSLLKQYFKKSKEGVFTNATLGVFKNSFHT